MTDPDQGEKVRSLHDAYSAGNSKVTSVVYDNWSKEYEAHMRGVGYTHPTMTAAMFARYQSAGDAPVLDAGAGTGILGEILPALGYPKIDGFDASAGMLALAAKKNLYRDLKFGVLGERLDYEDNSYAGATASGVYTEGHAPLSSLNELVRVVQPGGYIVFSVARIYLGEQIEAKAKQLEDADKWRRAGTSTLYDSTPFDNKAIMAQIYAFEVLS
jgi:predicted TPR repeat methyltransferase